jgi:DNA-directed RNA polymerase beta' subunit
MLLYKGEKKNGNALVLNISGHGIENIPTLLARKKCNPPKVLNTTWEKIEVEELDEPGEYYGFEVDGNNLFVLPDFTVVHNCEQTGRTVIGPDPTLKMGQLAIPEEMAKILTIPIQVTNFNINYLTDLVNNGKVNYILKDNGTTKINLDNALFFKGTRLNHGDIIIRKDKESGKNIEIEVNNGKNVLETGDILKRNGEILKDIKYPEKRKYHLNIGDICERQLTDGDIVLLNRQPTLHEGSMMAQEIIVRPGKTLRFNLSIAKSFNADESSI